MATARKGGMDLLSELTSNIKRDRAGGSKATAQKITKIFADVIASDMWLNATELMKLIKQMGAKLIAADPMAFYIGNIVKRIAHIIRMQSNNCNVPLYEEKPKENEENLDNPLMEMDSLNFLIGEENKLDEIPLVKTASSMNDTRAKDPAYRDFKSNLEESLLEIQTDIEEAYGAISFHCREQFQDNDTVLTIGYSSTVLELFKDAKEKSDFTVVVAENSPENSGKTMQKRLSSLGIKTILLADTSIFSYMSKINKVIISTRAIMADGGLITDAGVELAVLAADYHTVPVIVVSALYKLTPLYPFDNTTYNKIVSPKTVLNSKECKFGEKVDVIVAKYDYIEPEYISLYITNVGCHTPHYIYREFAEYYSKEELHKV
ncbi:unnamed protein product [Moneuplotes crassus]|uniref:Translation initiation factor eIF2B subunit beta n=1 Tax=Euplotes crassus TaxID=5936 RepID=A0AAD1XDH0_EUPCR|nr:unnamed protein product [Moneuplotes crassus]